MTERYRWDEEEKARAEGEKIAAVGPDLTNKEFYGVGGDADPEQPRLQLGDEAVEQPGGGTSAYDAQARPVSDAHHAEGGFVPRGVHTQSSLQDRTFWDKAKDEVKSWTGDHDAEARRKADHIDDEARAAPGGDWEGNDDDTGWRDPVSPGKEAEIDRGSPPTQTRKP